MGEFCEVAVFTGPDDGFRFHDQPSHWLSMITVLGRDPSIVPEDGAWQLLTDLGLNLVCSPGLSRPKGGCPCSCQNVIWQGSA